MKSPTLLATVSERKLIYHIILAVVLLVATSIVNTMLIPVYGVCLEAVLYIFLANSLNIITISFVFQLPALSGDLDRFIHWLEKKTRKQLGTTVKSTIILIVLIAFNLNAIRAYNAPVIDALKYGLSTIHFYLEQLALIYGMWNSLNKNFTIKTASVILVVLLTAAYLEVYLN